MNTLDRHADLLACVSGQLGHPNPDVHVLAGVTLKVLDLLANSDGDTVDAAALTAALDPDAVRQATGRGAAPSERESLRDFLARMNVRYRIIKRGNGRSIEIPLDKLSKVEPEWASI